MILCLAALAACGPERPAATGCAERAFLQGAGGYGWGTLTRWRGGWLTAHHVIDGQRIVKGPDVSILHALPATDLAFMEGAPVDAAPSGVAPLEGVVSLSGFPARATSPTTVRGEVHAPDTVPPGVWVRLDTDEPLVGGFSGGCVQDAEGRVVAVIMGAGSMRVDGEPRHFARVVPLRAALAEAQGHPVPPPPLGLARRAVPRLEPWR